MPMVGRLTYGNLRNLGHFGTLEISHISGNWKSRTFRDIGNLGRFGTLEISDISGNWMSLVDVSCGVTSLDLREIGGIEKSM
jgi:hypothetical protein